MSIRNSISFPVQCLCSLSATPLSVPSQRVCHFSSWLYHFHTYLAYSLLPSTTLTHLQLVHPLIVLRWHLKHTLSPCDFCAWHLSPLAPHMQYPYSLSKPNCPARRLPRAAASVSSQPRTVCVVIKLCKDSSSCLDLARLQIDPVSALKSRQ